MFRYLLTALIIAVSFLGCSKGENPKETAKASAVKQVSDIRSQEADQSGDKEQERKIINFDVPSMPEGADGTFVVAADVVFVRDNPKKILPHENMSYRELDDEYHWSYERPFPQHFFYGENITGTRDKDNPDVVITKIKQYDWKEGKQIEKGETTGYVDIRKLWHEPSLAKVSTDRWMTVQGAKAYLIPDKKSPEVMSLFQGEVVEVVGQLENAGDSWVKATFCDKFEYDEYVEIKYEPREYQPCGRYGYIESKNLQPLFNDKIDQSHLTASEIPNSMRHSKLSFSDKERELLAGNGFYIDPPSPSKSIYVDDMADLYNSQGASSFFITSDLFLHTFHLVFDRMLQDIEEKKLFPAIQSLTNKLINETKKEIKSAKDKDAKIQKALLHNLFFFSVAAKLFDPEFTVPNGVRSDVEAVVKRIAEADGALPSLKNKIELGDEDFTQYRVRGHYQKRTSKTMDDETGKEITKTDDTLERYFRGMMWYGRHSLLISDDNKTMSAILMVRALESSGGLKEWERIDNVLARLIGKTDDWTPKDYGNVNTAIFGKKAPSLDDVAKGGDKAIKDFKARAIQILPKQRIVSVQTGVGQSQKERVEMTSGFKFLGQRFSWDAYIFTQLTSPSVGRDANPRNLPASLDVMYILGSKAAGELQADQKYENYGSQVEKLKKEIAGEIEKKGTTYDSWLGTYQALFNPTKSRQLFAFQFPWQFKELNSALGSWTELKHDTILYSEQSYAESGSGDSFQIPGYEPPYVKGYVEPNPAFFSRLIDMLSSLRSGLKGGFLTDEYADKLQTFESLVKRAYKIAEKEVEGDEITKDDYAWIEQMSRSFDRSLLLPREIGDIIEPDYLKMAIIADVATDAVSGRVLEAAIGAPQRIVVAVKDYYGGTRLTVGYVYSWYEFAGTKRWTDAEWKKMVYSSDKKLDEFKPSWYSKFQK